MGLDQTDDFYNPFLNYSMITCKAYPNITQQYIIALISINSFFPMAIY